MLTSINKRYPMAASSVYVTSTTEQDSLYRHRPELAATIAAAEQAQQRDTFKVTKEQPSHFQSELIDTSINDSGKRKLAYLHYLLDACVPHYEKRVEEHHVAFIRKLQALLQVIIKSPLSAEDFIKKEFYTSDGLWLNISTLDHVYLLRFCLQEVKNLQPTDFSSLATGLKAISSFFGSKEKQTSITQDLFKHIEPATLQLESLIWPYDLFVDTQATDRLADEFAQWLSENKPTTFSAIRESLSYRAMLAHGKQLSAISIKQPASLLQQNIIISLLKENECDSLDQAAQLVSPKVDVIFVTLGAVKHYFIANPVDEKLMADCFAALINDIFVELTSTLDVSQASDNLLTRLTTALKSAQSSLAAITGKSQASLFKGIVETMLAQIEQADSDRTIILQQFIKELMAFNFKLAVEEQTLESKIAIEMVKLLIQSAKTMFNAASLVDVTSILSEELGKRQRHAERGGRDSLPACVFEALKSDIERLSTVAQPSLSPR